MTHSYHARQDLRQIQLAAYEESARSQEADILIFMKMHPSLSVTAESLKDYFIPVKEAPLTSIRRALTNLSNTGQIVKTGTVQGQYRRPINTYRYGVISHV